MHDFQKYFPLAVYLGLGGFVFALIGAALYVLACGNKTSNQANKGRGTFTLLAAIGTLIAAYAGYTLVGAFGFPKKPLMIAGAAVYALAFAISANRASKGNIRKTLIGSLYGTIATAVAGVLFLMLFGAHVATPEKQAKIDVTDKVSLQRGAAIFRDYCLSCHALSMVRYNQLTKIGMTEDDIRQNMLTTADKVGDTMQVAMHREDAQKWLGIAPPDLSLEAAAKKPNWIYSYLTGFYKDETRPTGWNNIYFANVGMPHVLWQEEGVKEAVFEDVADPNDPSKTIKEFKGFTEAKGGKRDKENFEQAANDVTNFLVWASEPDQHSRKMIGFGVLAFLLVLFTFAWRLNKNYWKDIH